MSAEKIQNIVGEQFTVTKRKNGYSVGLKALESKGHQLCAEQQYEALVAGWTALQKAGLVKEVPRREIRMSYPTANNKFVPWPHIWLSEEQVEKVEGTGTTSEVASLRAQMEELKQLLTAKTEKTNSSPVTSQDETLF